MLLALPPPAPSIARVLAIRVALEWAGGPGVGVEAQQRDVAVAGDGDALPPPERMPVKLLAPPSPASFRVATWLLRVMLPLKVSALASTGAQGGGAGAARLEMMFWVNVVGPGVSRLATLVPLVAQQEGGAGAQRNCCPRGGCR